MSGQAGGALRQDTRDKSRGEMAHEAPEANAANEPGALEGIQACIADCDAHLLNHRYFKLCDAQAISRTEILEIVKQLYCFSVFFERILTRRIAEFSSIKDHRVVDIARGHLKEEIGHAMLFHGCLVQNGFPAEDVPHIAPKMFTKALFGYLLATVQHENEYVTNIAIMQVMESIGYHFFNATLGVLKQHGMMSAAFAEHSEADEDHRSLGLELTESFDETTLAASKRIINDVYRLMGFVLDEWLDGAGDQSPWRFDSARPQAMLESGVVPAGAHARVAPRVERPSVTMRISSLLTADQDDHGAPSRDRK